MKLKSTTFVVTLVTISGLLNVCNAAEKTRGPFDINVNKVEALSELAGKKPSRGQFICVQYIVTNHAKAEEQFVPPHLVIDPVGSQKAEATEASAAYTPKGWHVDRPKFGNFKAGQTMNRVACFDALILDNQKGRLTFAYGGYGPEHPAWNVDLPLPTAVVAQP